MCLICSEIAGKRMNYYNAMLAFVELASTMTSEHVMEVSVLIDSIDPSNVLDEEIIL